MLTGYRMQRTGAIGRRCNSCIGDNRSVVCDLFNYTHMQHIAYRLTAAGNSPYRCGAVLKPHRLADDACMTTKNEVEFRSCFQMEIILIYYTSGTICYNCGVRVQQAGIAIAENEHFVS